MRRADRLFQIVQHLRGGRLVTAGQLADRLEVSQRTIYRDIADLIGSGVPIDGEAGVGYIMRAGYDLPPLMFTNDEVAALVAGAPASGVERAAMGAAAQEALVKIEAVLPDAARSKAEQVQVHAFQSHEMTETLRRLFDRIDCNIKSGTRTEIDYEDKDGTASARVIRPLGLFFWGKVWTMVGWCELSNDFRMFRLDRISATTGLDHVRPDPGKSLKAFYASAHARAPQSHS